MDWKEKITIGMKMIIEGCNQKDLQIECIGCPFSPICNTILRDKKSYYSTPDCWEKEGIF